MVEPRIVVPDVAGSNPVGHPNKFSSLPENAFLKKLANLESISAGEKTIGPIVAG
jgi:hypothetical protein